MTRLILKLLFAICLVWAVSGCESSAVDTADAGLVEPIGVEAVRPTFTIGDQFWFSDGREIFVETFMGLDDGRLVFETGSSLKTAYYSPDLALVEVRRPFGADQAYRPDNARLSFPLTVGKTWVGRFRIISSGSARSVHRTRSCEVVGTGQTKVPAGIFAIFRIVCRTHQFRSRRFVHEELHYAPAVGRFILRRTWNPIRTIRLTEFSRAK